MLIWRHHCRYCGGVFCGDCADKEFLLMPPRESAGDAVRHCLCSPVCPRAYRRYEHTQLLSTIVVRLMYGVPPSLLPSLSLSLCVSLCLCLSVSLCVHARVRVRVRVRVHARVFHLRGTSLRCRPICSRQPRGFAEAASLRCAPAKKLDRSEVRLYII